MAGEEALKVAAANIRRAVQEKQDQIRELETELDRSRSQAQHAIDDLNRDIQQKDALATHTNTDTTERLHLHQAAQEDRRAIDVRRQAESRLHDDIKRQVADIERQIRDLTQKASEFERAITQ